MNATTRLAVAQLRRSPRRILAIALATLLSAMAIMATGTFIGTLNQGMAASLAAPVSKADAVIVNANNSISGDDITAIPGVESAEPVTSTYARLQISGATFDTHLHSLANDPALRWVQLESGAWPAAPTEVLTTTDHLERFGLAIGDRVTFNLAAGESTAVTIVGTVSTMAPVNGLPWFIAPTDLLEQAGVPANSYIVSGDVASETLVTRINSALQLDAANLDGMHAETVSEYVNHQLEEESGSTQVLTAVFLVFVCIAMLSAIMVVRNTFQVLLAQRMRENGLLRLIGASGGQVQATVLTEATIVGLLASCVGAVVGVLLGWGIAVLADLSAGGPEVSIGWALAAISLSTLMTVFAAWAPAAKLRSLSPVAALDTAHETAAEQRRRNITGVVLGVACTALGIAGVTVAALHTLDTGNRPLVFIASAVVLAIGLFVLVPVVVRRVMPVLVAPLRRSGPVATIASENLVRTARRSATVVLSIAFGGSLVLALLTAVGGLTATMNHELDEKFPFDAVLTDADGESIPQQQVASLLTNAAVDSAEFSQSVKVTSSDASLPITELTTLPPSVANELGHPIGSGEVLVSKTWLSMSELTDGETIALTATDGTPVSVTVRANEGLNSLGMFTPQPVAVGVVDARTIDMFGAPKSDTRLWLRASADQIDELARALDEVRVDHPNLTLDGPIAMQQMFVQAMNMLVAFVLAMLALTVIISALGLATVIALAVAERSREIALLRALGMTRRKIRRMVVIESIVLASVGAFIAIVVGVPLGMAAVPAFIAQQDIAIAIPWLGICGVIAIATLIGVLAAANPARKATRIAPAQALSRG